MRIRRIITIVGFVAVATAAGGTTAAPVAAQDGLALQAAKGTLRIPHIQTSKGDKALTSLSGGVVEAARQAYLARREASSKSNAPLAPGSNGTGIKGQDSGQNVNDISPDSLGCSRRTSNGNDRVNQDCSYRRQAEEVIKFNPANPTNLVAGQNDSRIGYNHCGFDYSLDSGHRWGDGLPPFWFRENHPEADGPVPGDPNTHTILGGTGTDRTYDFASDPAVAVDSQGRSFFSCVVISLAANEGDDPNDNATGLLVTASEPGAFGSFYNTVPPGDPLPPPDQVPASQRTYVVAEDNNAAVFHDKPFITADFYANSPNKDNVYVTWSVFRAADPACSTPIAPVPFCSPIFGSMTTDHGLHWSTPEEISGVNAALCSAACNQDQGSDPIVVPDGTGGLVVTYYNVNTPSTINQELAVRCQPSGNSAAGTAHFNCGSPTLVGPDVQTGEPLCDFGRGPEECIPGAYIRTNDFPRIAVNRDNGHLFVTWQDNRTGELDINLAESTDGGVTWSEAAAPVNPDKGKDHYFPAVDVAASPQGLHPKKEGDHVGVSYYRTDRIPNESAVPAGGFAPGVNPGVAAELSDYALAGGRGLDTPYGFKVVSPEFPPPDGNQTGFNGDYSGLAVVNDVAHPIWSDTRNVSPYLDQGVVHDEDVFTKAIGLPDGRGD